MTATPFAAASLVFALSAPQGEGWVTHHVELSPAAALVARGSMHAEEGTSWLLFHDARTGLESVRVPFGGPIRDMSFSADGSLFAASQDRGRVVLFDPATGKKTRELTGHSGWVWAVALSPDGRLVASSGRDRTLLVRDVATGGERLRETFDRYVARLAFRPGRSEIVVAFHPGSLDVWTLDGTASTLAKALEPTADMAVSADGRWLAHVQGDGELRLFDLETRALVWKAMAHEDSGRAVAFSRTGDRVATSGGDRSLRAFAREDGRPVFERRTKRSLLALGADADSIVGADYDGGVERFGWAESGR